MLPDLPELVRLAKMGPDSLVSGAMHSLPHSRWAATDSARFGYVLQAGMALESLSRVICSRLSCPLPPRASQRPPRPPKQSLKEMPEASQALFAFMSGPYSTLLKVSSPGRCGDDPASAPAHWEPAALCRVLEVRPEVQDQGHPPVATL